MPASEPLGFVPITTEVSATLPVSAELAFDAFSDVAGTPQWLSILQSARVARFDTEGRPQVVAFLARLERATVGYSLHYQWDEATHSVSWSTPEGGSVLITGDAQFTPLSTHACLLHYRLTMELPFDGVWVNESFTGNAAATVASEFREYLRGLCPTF
jgi:hypothetical protein